MNNEFYSRGAQFRRELQVLWQLYSVNTLMGGLYVLASFYVFREVGNSQIYNVISPCIVASYCIGYLSYIMMGPQAQGNTLPYFASLPRDRRIAWKAQVVYGLCTIIFLMVAVLLGTQLKLGNAGITPHYRLHPEMLALPFLSMVVVSVYVHARHSKGLLVIGTIFGLTALVGITFWAIEVTGIMPDESNSYAPERGIDLGLQCGIAVALLILSAILQWCNRLHWFKREVGEIK